MTSNENRMDCGGKLQSTQPQQEHKHDQ